MHTEFLAAMQLPAYLTDAEGTLTFFNEAAAAFWGHRPELGKSKWCGSWRLFSPDGLPLLHEDCALAVTLRSGIAVVGGEAISERPDGTRAAFMPYPSLLKDADGVIIGAINLLVDLVERSQTYLQQERLAAIVSSSEDIIISKSLDGIINSWNTGATRILGYEEAEMIGQPIMRIIPTDLAHEETEIIDKIRRGERIEHFDTERLTKDGRRIHLSLTVSPLRNRLGQIVGASKIARDITERKRNEELQRLLFNELNHRVKNTLAIIQAIATQSLRRSVSPDDFVKSFSGRVQALARAHNLLVRGEMKSSRISELVEEHVLLGQRDHRTSFAGPDIRLTSEMAVQLGMVLHELATNARKYGALSIPDGALNVTWRVSDWQVPEVVLDWRESGLTNLTPPERAGFGTTLIGHALDSSGGAVSVEYSPGGVYCQLRLPLSEGEQRSLAALAVGGAGKASREAESEPAEQLRDRSILLVEDEVLIAMDLVDLLTEEGMIVIGPGRNLDQAHKLAQAGGYDIALLDANLNGSPVDSIADLMAKAQVPFAFCTGYGAEALPDGHKHRPVLAKPFGRSELLSVLQDLLAPKV